MSYWTIEEVADHLNLTVGQVRESRRRKEYPGNIGKQRGRRLMFDADLVQAGPQAQESTNDPLVALLWTAQGIEAKLVEIINELKAQQPTNEHPIETWRRQLGQTEWDRILDHTSAQRVRELIRLMDEGEEE